MSAINIPNEYSVELTPPDISPYAAGNTGIPYIWTFESGQPGPHVMISAIVHGNEPAGAIALDWLMQAEVRPVAGTLSFGFMNIAAYEAFDPADANATRWLDEDFNRVWDVAVLEGDRQSRELTRAREVRPAIDKVDLLLDIHTMQHLAPPLMMSGRHPRAKALAAEVRVPERVVGDAGHKAGRRMRDYGGFDAETGAKTALLIECGQHWEAAAGILAKEAAARFLVATGAVAPDFADDFPAPAAGQKTYTVKNVVTIETDGFAFAEAYTGGEVIPAAGTVIAQDGDRPVTTPEDEMMLVMPSKRLWPGQTAVRLATRDR